MPMALVGILDPRSAANQYRSLPIAGYVSKYGFWTRAWALLFHRLSNSKAPLRDFSFLRMDY
jgi:hypothetical protein